jgi:hypothetical protein
MKFKLVAQFHQVGPPDFMLTGPLRSVSDGLTFWPPSFPRLC